MPNMLFKKGLVAGIIVLFIGVTIASGISFKVNTSKTFEAKASESELVKFPVCICKPDGIENYEVFITQQQVEDLDILINDFKQKLKGIKTLEETSILFNDTISSMYELGVIPNEISIEEAQQLVTGDSYNLKPENITEMKNTQSTLFSIWNDLCFIYSNATNIEWWFRIYFGYLVITMHGDYWYNYAKGLVWTNGLNGIQALEGRFKGGMGEIDLPASGSSQQYGYAGTIGFMGILISRKDFLIGFALIANFQYIGS